MCRKAGLSESRKRKRFLELDNANRCSSHTQEQYVLDVCSLQNNNQHRLRRRGLENADDILETFKNQPLFSRGMPKKHEGLGPVKRFGVRYGRTVKFKRAVIEKMQKASTKCPYCHKDKVVRKTKGIWHCTKCTNTFTGQAYTFFAKPAALPPIEQVLAETQEKSAEEAVETTE